MYKRNDGSEKIDVAESAPESLSTQLTGASNGKKIVQRITIKVQRGIYSVSRNLDSNFRC